MDIRSATRAARQSMVGVLVLLLFGAAAYGETYYVRIDGNDSSRGLANDSGSAWRTIAHAADSVSAGDTVRVQAGMYSERVSPSVSGTPGNVITFVADGMVTMCGWDISSKHYLRIIGFVMDGDAGCALPRGVVSIEGTNSYLEFWRNTIRDGRYNGIRMGVSDVLNNALVIDNTLFNFDVGGNSGMAIAIRGDHNFIAYNEIHHSFPDAILASGSYRTFS